MLVALDDLWVADLRSIGVLAELAACPPLPQEIPALVELNLKRQVALAIVGRVVVLAVEPVLLVDEVLNAMQYALVVHGTSGLNGIRVEIHGHGVVPARKRGFPDNKGDFPDSKGDSQEG